MPWLIHFLGIVFALGCLYMGVQEGSVMSGGICGTVMIAVCWWVASGLNDADASKKAEMIADRTVKQERA
jgi:hypothetical protein